LRTAGDAMAMITAIFIASVGLMALRAQQPVSRPETSATAALSSADEPLPGGLRIKNKPIQFDQERIQLTLAYRRLHQDPAAKDINIQPKMVILHWTGISSFESTWNYFNRTRAEAARSELAAAGEVNVSAHFLVDRDGTIYRLVPETWMARHCIGLNHVA